VISVAQLENIAEAKLLDAMAAYELERYDLALDCCGYAVEIALKAAICKHQGWPEFPHTDAEFNAHPHCQRYKNHVFRRLIPGTGITIPPHLSVQWTLVSTWRPDSRYNPQIIGDWNTTAVLRQNMKRPTEEMIEAAEAIVGFLL
jgi:HEPN domain-containing protein